MHECDWTAASVAELKRFATARTEQRLDPTTVLEGENEMAKIWAAREREAPRPEVYEKSLAGQWREAGCAATEAPYVLHALIDRLPSSVFFPDQSPSAKALASAFLDEAHCPGAHGLSEADKALLRVVAAPAAPPPPKP
jgi:hypothetical protein